MAEALGADVTLVTRLTSTFDRSSLAGFELRSYPAARMVRYQNSYDRAGNRTQLLLDAGEPLEPGMMECERSADAFILAPAYHEVADWPFPCARVRGVSLQGILRDVDSSQRVRPRTGAVAAAMPFVHNGVVAFFSEEDTPSPEALGREIAAVSGARAIVTRGYRGAIVFEGETLTAHPALPALAVDPTGAGDCFSTAYIVRFAETRDHASAMRFALSAGALSVEAPGISGIPTRAAIEQRLEMVAA